MKVFKFGGASVNSIERIQNVANIIRHYGDESLVIIISAIGKTTNALEKVAEVFYAGNKDEALNLFNVVKQQHLNTAKYLLVTEANACNKHLNDFFTEVEWLLHDKPVRDFDYYYDQIVCVGELLSTSIISHYLNELSIKNNWKDVRDIIKTDNNFRDAGVDWTKTALMLGTMMKAQNENQQIIVTQGFIGCTDDNESTTLGREGSDYSAAIFANVLKASSLSIWKDVPGMLSGDPKVFPSVVRLEQVPYREAIELAFYGASIIHPKTIQPLEQGGTTLRIRSFVDPEAPGTEVGPFAALTPEVPCWIRHENQVLIEVSSRDLSFLSEGHLSEVYRIFAEEGLLVRAAQHTALSTRFAVNDDRVAVPRALERLNTPYRATAEYGLRLTTVRRPDAESLATLLAGGPLRMVLRNHEVAQVLTAPN